MMATTTRAKEASAEIQGCLASINWLLQSYVRKGSDLAVALSRAGIELGEASLLTNNPSQFRRKPVGRFSGGAR